MFWFALLFKSNTCICRIYSLGSCTGCMESQGTNEKVCGGKYIAYKCLKCWHLISNHYQFVFLPHLPFVPKMNNSALRHKDSPMLVMENGLLFLFPIGSNWWQIHNALCQLHGVIWRLGKSRDGFTLNSCSLAECEEARQYDAVFEPDCGPINTLVCLGRSSPSGSPQAKVLKSQSLRFRTMRGISSPRIPSSSVHIFKQSIEAFWSLAIWCVNI